MNTKYWLSDFYFFYLSFTFCWGCAFFAYLQYIRGRPETYEIFGNPIFGSWTSGGLVPFLVFFIFFIATPIVIYETEIREGRQKNEMQS